MQFESPGTARIVCEELNNSPIIILILGEIHKIAMKFAEIHKTATDVQ